MARSGEPLRAAIWSGRPDSNRRRPAWEAGILPLNYARPSPPILAYLRAMSKPFSRSSPRAFQTIRLVAP